jgi:hypothetical protein
MCRTEGVSWRYQSETPYLFMPWAYGRAVHLSGGSAQRVFTSTLGCRSLSRALARVVVEVWHSTEVQGLARG